MKMELRKLKKCDMDKPYIFVSYSSANRDLVWEDVYILQQKGYNIWIDDKMIDKTKSSWENDALEAITTLNCKLLVFYVSKDSLSSKPCLNEMQATISEEAKKFNRKEGKLKFIAVDAEEIKDFDEYVNELFTEYEDSNNSEKYSILYDMCNKFFDTGNARVRILNKHTENRKTDYYSEIETCIPDKVKNQPGISEVDVEKAKEKIIDSKTVSDEKIIESCSKGEVIDTSRSTTLTQSKPAPLSIAPICDDSITIGDIRKKFEDITTVTAFRQVREGMPRGGKGAMDYAMASILNSCNQIKEDSPAYQINYYCYAVADPNNKKEGSGLGATWTWSSNCRKVLGLEKSGPIPVEIDQYFKSLPESTTLRKIEKEFIESKEEAYQTKKNDLVVEAIQRIYKYFK